MSHAPERQEKDCLNCGTIVQGKYCHVCGQENIVPKETFWSMVIHFFYDITHFDGIFFTTSKDLLFKPGFLSKEYMKGRRKSYFHPVRMYVFTSAFFFLIFFSFFSPIGTITTNTEIPITPERRAKIIADVEASLKSKTGDSVVLKQLAILMDTSKQVTLSDIWALTDQESPSVSVDGKKYKSKKEYDSLQQLLPVSERHGWFMRRMVINSIEVNKKFENDPDNALRSIGDKVLHKLPYMLLLSLPLFALLLKLVYIRRKNFYYADHGVFSIHLYVFTFLMLLVLFSLGELFSVLKWDWFGWVVFIFLLGIYFYLYKAMRKFYEQRRGKTILKFLIVSLFSFIMMITLLALFFFFSVFTF